MNDQGWKLHDAPLPDVASRLASYRSGAHDEALARLLFITEQHRHCGLLYGPPGSGKTTLLAELDSIVRRSAREIAVVDLHGQDQREILWELSGELGLNPQFTDHSFALWRRVQDHFLSGIGGLPPSVVVLDHADQGTDEAKALVSRLTHLAVQGRGLTLILAVRATSLADLPTDLQEATDLRIELPWLTEQQTFDFVCAAFQSASEPVAVFEDAAIRRMYVITAGSVRMLAQLGELARLSAIASDEVAVSEQTVLTAANDLQITGPTARRSPVVTGERHFYD